MSAWRADGSGSVIPIIHTEACNLGKWNCFSRTTETKNATPCSQGCPRKAQTHVISLSCLFSPCSTQWQRCEPSGLLAPLCSPSKLPTCGHRVTSGQQQALPGSGVPSKPYPSPCLFACLHAVDNRASRLFTHPFMSSVHKAPAHVPQGRRR